MSIPAPEWLDAVRDSDAYKAIKATGRTDGELIAKFAEAMSEDDPLRFEAEVLGLDADGEVEVIEIVLPAADEEE